MTSLISSLEQAFMLALVCGLGMLGLHRRKQPVEFDGAYLDKSFSGALKGLGILLVVLGHYAQMQMEWGLCNRVILFDAWYAPNIGLVLFFFISGYGLAISKKHIDNYLTAPIQRLGKVFLPMALVFACSLVLYAALPCKFDAAALARLHIPDELVMLQTSDFTRPIYILLGAVRWYWFVWCILAYYVIFYLAEFVNKRYLRNSGGALVLFVFLMVYYIAARKILGPSLAHYYRLTWSFLLGFLVARSNVFPIWQVVLTATVGLLTFYFESENMRESFYVAMIILALAFWLNRTYEYVGKTLAFLGGVSYMLYLCHRRITWVLMSYGGINDVLMWVVVSIVIAYGFTLLYSILTRNTRFSRNG